MKELFSRQEAMRRKPIEEESALTAERNTLAAKVEELEERLSNGRVANETLQKQYQSARSDVKRVEAKMREGKALREAAESEVFRLEDRVREKEKRRKEAEKREEDHRVSTKTNLRRPMHSVQVRKDCLPYKYETMHQQRKKS
jgi:chromosome segregation ATPase